MGDFNIHINDSPKTLSSQSSLLSSNNLFLSPTVALPEAYPWFGPYQGPHHFQNPVLKHPAPWLSLLIFQVHLCSSSYANYSVWSAEHIICWPNFFFNTFMIPFCISLLELPWQNITEYQWVTETTEFCFLTVLLARSPRSSAGRVGFSWRLSPWLRDGCLLPQSLWGFLCVCVLVLISSNKNTSPFGFGLILKTSF